MTVTYKNKYLKPMGKFHILKGEYLGLNVVDGMSLLLKTPYTLEKQGPDTSELELTQMPHT